MSDPLSPAYVEVLDLVKRRGLEPHDVVSELTQALAVAAWEHGVPVSTLVVGVLIVWGELDAGTSPDPDSTRRPVRAMVRAAASIAGDATS